VAVFIGAALCIAIVAIVLGNLTNSYVTLIVAAFGMVVLGGLLRQRRGASTGRHATADQGRLKHKSE
jgi:Flp pilus assembly protein TadB